jgi:hypothetical protein
MSKNLRGLSGSSVTINLLDIDANSVTATTGTFTDIIATNYSINNVSISNLIVSGVVRLTGIVDAPVTLLPEHEILIKDPYTNLVYKFSSLVFNAGTGSLKSPDIITATMTVGDIYVTGILTLAGSMPALQVTGQTDLGTGLSIQSLASVASNSVHPLVLWNSTTKNISQDNTKLYYDTSTDTLYSPSISVTNFNIVPVTRSDDVEYPVVFFDDNTDNLAVDSVSNAFTFNPSTNKLKTIYVDITFDLVTGRDTFLGGRLYVNNINPVQSGATYGEQYPLILWHRNATSGSKDVAQDFQNLYYDTTTNTLYAPNISATITNLQIVAINKSDNIDYPVTFHDTTLNKVCKDLTDSSFRYNPSSNKLSIYNGNVEFNLEVSNYTFLGSNVYVNTLKPVVTNTTYPLLLWDNTGALDDRAISTDTTKLYYDTTSDTMYAPNITVNTVLNAVDATITGDMDVSGDVTIVAVNATVTPANTNCRLLFLEGSTLTGRISGNGCYYNPDGDVMFANRLQGTVHSRSPLFLITSLGLGNASIQQATHSDDEVYLRYGQSFGHLFRIGTLPSLLITTSLSTIYTPFRCDGDCTIEYKPALASEARDMRVVVSDVGASDKTIKQHNQFTFNPSTTLLSVPNIDATAVTTGTLQCDNVLTLNSVPTAPINANTDILLLASSTNQITKSGITFNPSGSVLSTGNITLTGAISALSVTTTSNATIGGNLDVTNNMTVSGAFTCGDINFGNLDATSASGKITVQQPIQYGAGVFSQPLNYTIRIGTTDLIRTIDTASGTGFNSGKYGNGVTLSILRSGVKATSYGQDSELITWNPYIDATNTATNFTLGGLPGLWDIKMTCKYTSAQLGNSNRVNPIVRAVLNNTTTIDGGDQSSYIRHNVGRVGGIVWHNKIYLNASDSIRFDTYANFGAVINYTSIIASTDFDLSDFMFIATFLGPLDEYDKTPA